MQKTILITGATDGIGLEAAKILVDEGHNVLLHGRNPEKLAHACNHLSASVETYCADLSVFDEVKKLAESILAKHTHLDVLINNAGVLNAAKTVTPEGLDVRFMVNTIAPYLLTQQLLPLFDQAGRIINLSSAAQASIDLDALCGRKSLIDMEAYAQSKLAITMWSRALGLQWQAKGPVVVALNPGSLLATKMVKEGFGIEGKDLTIGANIIVEAALGEKFAAACGQYFDNDTGQFANPHADALDQKKVESFMSALDELIAATSSTLLA